MISEISYSATPMKSNVPGAPRLLGSNVYERLLLKVNVPSVVRLSAGLDP
jgi:hypothetical protein